MFSFRKLWRRLISLFLKPAPRVLITRPTRRDPATKQDIPLITRPTRRDSEPEPTEDRGLNLYRHLGHALQSLDECFDYLERLKRFDPEKYALCSGIGATMVSARAVDRETPFVIDPNPENWPGLLMTFFPKTFNVNDDPDDPNWLNARFSIYVKSTRRYVSGSGFIPRGQVFYECLVFYPGEGSRKGNAWPNRYFVGIDANGTAYALRHHVSKPQPIPSRGGYYHTIHHKTVMYPSRLEKLYTDHQQDDASTKMSIDEYVSRQLLFVIEQTIDAETGIQVNVKKGALQTRFGVPLRYTAYFFKDREFQATVNGARRRIFHYVKAHERVLADGSRHQVQAHFRGVRRFEWKGYHINLTVPTLHHSPVSEYVGLGGVEPPGLEAHELARDIQQELWEGTGEGPRV